VEVLKDFNASLNKLYTHLIENDPVVKTLLFDIVAKRGNEVDEFQQEIEAAASITSIPTDGLHALQFLYELTALMIPIENVTMPWRGPGCTGIIGADANGSVYHARNLDFGPGPYMQPIV